MALRILKANENVFSQILVDAAASDNLSKLNYASGKKGKKPRRKE